MELKEGESYIVHPSHLVAYSINGFAPASYRLKSSSLNLRIPRVATGFPEVRFLKTLRISKPWISLKKTVLRVRKWLATLIWGHRVRGWLPARDAS